MPRLPLGSAYQSASKIAGAQRRINLYTEKNQSAAPADMTLYPRPGLTPLGAPPAAGYGRGLYTSAFGDLYAFIGQSVYYIDPNFTFTKVGTILTDANSPVYAADNNTDAIIVDGSVQGYQIKLAAGGAGVFSQISDPNFLGANRVTFLNFFLLFNEPGTPNFYSTLAASNSFNALLFGSLTQYVGNCIGLIASEAALWLFSQWKGEIWADAGTSPFAFQPLSGVIVEHGLTGPYALARQDVNIYWLSQSPEGARMAMRGVGNVAERISTHAIEREWLTYPTIADCITQTYQTRGHFFVLYHFPTADRTWCFDEATHEWHEEAWYDANGTQHRTRDTFMAYAYGKNISLDWATGQLYQRDETNYTDNGTACVYISDVPHVVDSEDTRQTIWRVIADVECGNGTGLPLPQVNSPWNLGFNAGFGPQVLTEPPFMTLYISRDRGYTFFAHSDQLMAGRYGFNTRPTFNRCGVAYDCVLRFQWTGPFKTAFNAPFVVLEAHEADI